MAEEETEKEKQRQAKLFVQVAMTADTSRLDDEIRQRYCMSLNGCHRCLISTPIPPTGRTYGDCRKEVFNRLMGKDIPSQMTLDAAIAHAKEMADDTQCGQEHRQLADWLTELQNLRTTPLCNTAALYSALKAVLDLYDLGVVGLTAYGQGMPFDMIKNVSDIWLQARYALKAAPRNCDVGSEEDQRNRFHRFCEEGQHTDKACCGGCPIEVDGHRAKVGVSCELAWAQMPYNGDKK